MDIVRNLQARAVAQAGSDRITRLRPWLAAAAVVLVAAGGWWIAQRANGGDAVAPQATVAPPAEAPPAEAPSDAPTAAPPSIVAFVVPSINVRSGGESPTVLLPSGTDVLRLQLERGGAAGRPAHAVVRTVAGDVVWEGPAAAGPLGAAIVDVPAARLPADDYIISLPESGLSFFFRVQRP